MDDSAGSSVEISPAQCRELLATQSVGRVAFVTPDGPRIVPVNFALVDGSVEFRTSPYSAMALTAPGSVVAFEVDELDASTRSGWSVVVVGACERALDKSDSTFTPQGIPVTTPWAGGQRPLVLRIDAADITGRRVGHGEWHQPDA